jgi:hypothetical protein
VTLLPSTREVPFTPSVLPVVCALLPLSKSTINIQEGLPWTSPAGSLIGTAIGLFFSVKRSGTNIPRNISVHRKALMFGFFYFVFKEIWIIFLFGIGGLFSASKAFAFSLPQLA